MFPLVAIPAIAWILGILGIGTIVAAWMGWLVNFVVAIIILLIGIVLIGKYAEIASSSTNSIVPTVVLIASFFAMTLSVYMLDPALFTGIRLQSMVGEQGAIAQGVVNSPNLFALVPLAQADIMNLNPLTQYILIGVVLIGAYYLYFDENKGRGKR